MQTIKLVSQSADSKYSAYHDPHADTPALLQLLMCIYTKFEHTVLLEVGRYTCLGHLSSFTVNPSEYSLGFTVNEDKWPKHV